MNKNLYQNRFSVAPSDVDHRRSQFMIPHNHKTTANFSSLVPFYWQEILPGDTFDITTKMLARMSTPLYPVMDNAYIDYYYFFVPNRLVWSHWAEFMGENKHSAWVSDIEYFVPHAEVSAEPGGLLDHLGVPTYQNGLTLDIDFLLPRMYQLIWNEWFRNQNTTDPVLVNTGDNVTEDEKIAANKLLKVSKYFDYFTSALPSPQKGNAVDLPLGDYAPLKVFADNVSLNNPGNIQVKFQTQLGVDSGRDYFLGMSGIGAGGSGSTGNAKVYRQDTAGNEPDYEGNLAVLGFANVGADLSRATAATVNQLRQAFQMQRLLELQARSGTRYIEIIRASFGVLSPDARLQRPEYLGGSRVDINMQQVVQHSSTDAESPLGHIAAYSKTISGKRDFVQSFTEHGFIIGVMCARTAHTYQQGLHKMWSRRNRFDFYWPAFAHIGEQPIKLGEIYAQGNAQDNETFGYQEAWAEYRNKPNMVSGAFRSTVDSNLDPWHYADYYTSRPYLSAEWMNETPVNVDRTLAVQSSLHDQLIFDIQVNAKASRVMPLYSIPGLIDHM